MANTPLPTRIKTTLSTAFIRALDFISLIIVTKIVTLDFEWSSKKQIQGLMVFTAVVVFFHVRRYRMARKARKEER